MVTIKYYKCAITKDCELVQTSTVGEFLLNSGLSVQELQQLRFFKGDILGEEIDTSDTSFLDISDGEIEIINGDTIPHGTGLEYVPFIIAALSFAAAILLKPDIPSLVTDEGNTSSGSTTNRLGSSNNEAAVNARIPDVFGKVTKHTPPLIQIPYRIGVNDQETEVLLLAVGRGKYKINVDEIYDGDTPYNKIPNAQINIYEPNTYPNNGSPIADPKVGDTIDQPIGIYRESNDLNPSELLPPNDQTVDVGGWSIVGSSGSAVLTTGDTEVDLSEYFIGGQDMSLFGCIVNSGTYLEDVFRVDGNGTGIETSLTAISEVNIDGSYTVIAVSGNTLTISTPSETLPTGDLLDGTYDRFYNDTSDFNTSAPVANREAHTWYDVPAATPSRKLLLGTTTFAPVVGSVFGGAIGAITVYSGVTKILINITSSSGFYKLVSNEETSIEVDLLFTVEELDNNGDPTGNSFDTPVEYSSNETNTTSSVYRTVYIDIPYDNCQVYGRRITARDQGDSVSNVDKVEWTSLYSFEPHSVDMDLGDVTLMHCVVPSNSQSRLIKQRRTNLTLTRKLSYYYSDGSPQGNAESWPTSSFHKIITHMALDPKIGRLSVDNIDLDSFNTVANEVLSYFNNDYNMTEFGYVFDKTDLSFEDMYTIVCNAVNCVPFVQNGKYSLIFEKPQTESSMQITCRNKVEGSEVREDVFFKEYDGVELTYRNEESSVSEVIYVPDDRSANNPEKVEVLGIYNESQAIVRANRMRNKQIYHTTNVEFSTDEFGRLIVPAQRIDSPDGTRFVKHGSNTDGYNVYCGEIVEVNGLTIELSEPVSFTSGDHNIQFTNVEGENSEFIECIEGSDEFTVVLLTTPVEPLYDGYSRDKTKYTFCSSQARESIALLPQTIETKVDNGKETNTISSINYDYRYYQNDLD